MGYDIINMGFVEVRQMTFAEWLRGERELTGINQANMAKKIGITPQAYYRLEKGKHKATYSTILMVTTRLNLDFDTVLAEIEDWK